jgi:hypothetical protein
MPIGYGYVKDDKPLGVNWAEVGQKMNKVIDDDLKSREVRKEAIDKESFDYSKSLLEQPQGASAQSNRFMADFTTDASGQASRDLTDLKSGRISERDYYKKRANLKNGTTLMFQAAETFNKNYDAKMQRANQGISSQRELHNLKQMQGYLQFSESGAYINPLTAEVSVAKRYKDNKGNYILSNDPGQFANASQLVEFSTQEYNVYDLEANVKQSVDRFGNILIKDSKGGSRKEILNSLYDDPEALKKMNNAKDKAVLSFLADRNNTASILVDYMNEGYSFTNSEKEASEDEKKILIRPDNTVDFTTANGVKQLEAARLTAGDLFEAYIPRSISAPQEDPGMTDYQKDSLALRRRELDERKGRTDKKEDESIAVESVDSKVSSGDGDTTQTLEAVSEIPGEVNSEGKIENPDKVISDVRNVFDNNKAFKGVNLSTVETEIIPGEFTQETRTAGMDRSGTPYLKMKTDVIKEETLKLFVPEIMTEPLFIPMSKDQTILQDILLKLNINSQNGTKADPASLKGAFADDVIFDKYNSVAPVASAGDDVFNQQQK